MAKDSDEMAMSKSLVRQGDEHFVAKDFEGAIGFYKRAIDASADQNKIAFGNR